MQLLSLANAAQKLGVPPEILDRKRQSGEINAVNDGGHWKFRVEDVEQLARKQTLTQCADCQQPVHRAAGFCSRCGGRLAAESSEEKFLYRLRLIEQLIQCAAESDFDAADHAAPASGRRPRDGEPGRRSDATLPGCPG